MLDSTIEKLHSGNTLAVWVLSRLTRGGVAALFTIIGKVREKGGKVIETKGGTIIDSTVVGEAYVFAPGLAARI